MELVKDKKYGGECPLFATHDLRLTTSDKLYSRGELLKLAQMIKTVTQQMIAHPDATLREFSLASSLKARPECRQEPGQR